ncbi:Bifunctional inhibitor/plant lipid transfer protein/seed storage helical domain [Dillenia turbinata]|uniref:Bifunctional inhibitor/plant lipid transfer protein/seed storage helical domain n=1 Tax=Dillenia turbinata TaxID=194707 RepID=A0AAN8VMN7_9MAGN
MEVKLVVAAIVMLGVLEGMVMAEVSLCNMSEEDLMNCKPAVTKPNPVDPSPECCKAVMGANLKCLCSYRNSLWLPALGIDPHLAMQLPPKCNIIPPTNC